MPIHNKGSEVEDPATDSGQKLTIMLVSRIM